MPMYINFESYLSNLKAIESSKPGPQRRKVPSITELAKSIGMHQTTMSRLINNQVSQLSLETGDRIITEMRRRGFPMQVTDLVTYRPPDDLA